MKQKNENIEKRKKDLLEELAVLYKNDILDKELKIDNKKIEEKRQANVKDYFEGFYEELEIYREEKTKEIPVILRLYEEFIEEIYQPSKRYKLALKIRNEINTDIEKTFSKEQKEIMKQFKECESILIDDMIDKALVYVYAMCNQLTEETTKKYPMKNN